MGLMRVKHALAFRTWTQQTSRLTFTRRMNLLRRRAQRTKVRETLRFPLPRCGCVGWEAIILLLLKLGSQDTDVWILFHPVSGMLTSFESHVKLG